MYPEFRSRFTHFGLAAGVGLLFLVPAIGAEEPAAGSRVDGYVPPPRQLHNVAGHWTPYQPPAPPEGARVHVVEQGECLSVLAQKYYSNHRLWPVIWDANRWITYSHWIYPGDPVVVPPAPVVVTQQGPPPAAPAAAVEEPPQPVARKAAPAPAPSTPPPAGPVLVPAVDREEMICLGRMSDRMEAFPAQLIGAEEEDKVLLGQGDVVYMDRGAEDGVAPGSVWLIERPEIVGRKVRRHRPQPTFIQQLGLVRVIAAQEKTSTAEVIFSCDSLARGDKLTPFVEQPAPMIEPRILPALVPERQGRFDGRVVFSSEPRALVSGAGNFVWIDIAASAGVSPGDWVLFWRPAEGPWPSRLLGLGVVVFPGSGGSTVKLFESRAEIRPGDKAEVM